MLRLKDLVVSAAVLGLLACMGGIEKQLLSRFFVSCGAGDNATVANISLVQFPGVCESWEILEIGPERSEPFRVPELRRQIAEAKHERDLQYERGKNFLEDNYNSIEKIQIQLEENPDHEFTRQLGDVQVAWEKTIQERKDLERKMQDIKRDLERELRIVSMTMMSSPEIKGLDGNVTTKEVLLNVTTGGEEKPFAFILQKYNLINKEDDKAAASRWIIIDIQEKAT